MCFNLTHARSVTQVEISSGVRAGLGEGGGNRVWGGETNTCCLASKGWGNSARCKGKSVQKTNERVFTLLPSEIVLKILCCLYIAFPEWATHDTWQGRINFVRMPRLLWLSYGGMQEVLKELWKAGRGNTHFPPFVLCNHRSAISLHCISREPSWWFRRFFMQKKEEGGSPHACRQPVSTCCCYCCPRPRDRKTKATCLNQV